MKVRTFSLSLCLALLLTLPDGCGTARQAAADTAVVTDSAAAQPEEPGGETAIAFDGKEISISGTGASLEEANIVKISAGGVYRLSGESDNARVEISAGGETVTLLLDGCSLSYAEDETIYFKDARLAVVELASGTENTILSGTPREGDPAAADDDASGAALRAKCPLYLSGDGALTVGGYINNGIASSEDVTIEGGEIAVTAANDGVKSKQSVTVSGGTLDITAAQDGIQAEDSLTISGGAFSIITGGGADEDAMKTSDSAMMGMGHPSREASQESGDDETASETDAGAVDFSASDDMLDAWDMENTDAGSRKGLKASNAIVLRGGEFTLDTADDAIHCDGTVTIEDGVFSIRSADDGIHAEDELTINGGSIDIALCYEGLEAHSILQTGGEVSITAKDDGLNANGGEGFFGPMASGEASSENSAEDEETDNPVFRIIGGTLVVDSGGDGLDSNGDMYFDGGAVYVSGPSTNWDAALDYGERGELIITGGTLMAAGYSAMAEAPDEAEVSQPSIYYAQSDYCPDGAAVTLTDAEGHVLCQTTFAHSFNCVVLSCPELTVGQTYTLSMGGTDVEIEMTGTNFSNRTRGGMGFSSREASGKAAADEAAE